ncbi:MAG TPA: cupin domain-containing protein [Vicinamibacteria bacterium]|nr:cupin domain-containing protein [Vicinamibacteria bacterium]
MLPVLLPLFVLVTVPVASPAAPQPTTDVATYISAAEVLATIDAAPEGRVSDQQIRHVDAGDGYLGVGVVQRPPKAAGTRLDGIQHHKQGEVYRVVSGSGTLVTAKSLSDAEPLDPQGQIVLTLTGPSSTGVIVGGQSQKIGPGDIVIIPAGVAHGFSEITETITYLVIRIDPEKLVQLK